MNLNISVVCVSDRPVVHGSAGADLCWGRGHVPQIHLSPEIQKLADRSDVINSEVPKCSKIQIFQGSAPDPAGGAYRGE